MGLDLADDVVLAHQKYRSTKILDAGVLALSLIVILIVIGIKKEPRERGSKAHSLLPPTPNSANKLVNKLNTETNKLTVAST